MLFKYFKVCEKYFSTNNINFMEDNNSFTDFLENERLIEFLLKPFGKSFTGDGDERLLIEYIYTFLTENLLKNPKSENELYVPELRTYNVQHEVKRRVYVTDTYTQELESYLEASDADNQYVNTLETMDWFFVYDGDVTDTDDSDGEWFDTEFYDIYEI